MNNSLCIECNKFIHGYKYKNKLYRCGDANVCSITCSKKRYHKLEIVDPYLISPLSWYTVRDCNPIKKTESTPSFYPDTILNIENLNIENLNIDQVNVDNKNEDPTNIYTIFENIIGIINKFLYNAIVNIILMTK